VRDDEFRIVMAETFRITPEEVDRRLADRAERERLIASVTDEQPEEMFGHVPEGDEVAFMRRNMRITYLNLPPDSARCPDCDGTGDSFRSPSGIIRCRTCGGHGWDSC